MDPKTLRFAKTHEWVHVDGDTATVGISDFAVKELTDIVHLEFPQVGQKVAQGETFGEIESVKAVSDLYAPIAGEVVEANTGLEDDPTLLADDAYGAGWIVKLKVDGGTDNPDLMDFDAYQAFCSSESH